MNRGLTVALVLTLGFSILQLALHGAGELDLANAFLAPFSRVGHLFGTDPLGKDLWVKFVLGGVLTIGLAVPARLFTMFLATGLVLGRHFMPRLEYPFEAAAGVFLAMPSILLGLVLAYLLPGLFGLLAALVLCEWAATYAALDGKYKQLAAQDYIAAASLLGARPLHLFQYHFLPGLGRYWQNLFLTGVTSTIMTLSIISFLGLGIQELWGAQDWGSQIAFGKNYLLDFPLYSLLPSFGILITIWGIRRWASGRA